MASKSILVGNIPMTLSSNQKYYIGTNCYFASTHDIASYKNTPDLNTCYSKCDGANSCLEFDYTDDSICTIKSGTLIPYSTTNTTICSIKLSCAKDSSCLGKAVEPAPGTLATALVITVNPAPTASLDSNPSDFPTFNNNNSNPPLSTSMVILIIFLVCFTVITILGILVLLYRNRRREGPQIDYHEKEIQQLENSKLLQPRILVVGDGQESLAGTFDSTEAMDEEVSIHEPDTPIIEFPPSPDLSLRSSFRF
ncbi:hypothetical protein HDV01_003681 [Terramyces sp. JEL0728]|nr:hypothetical protein HDV01_003681 [Terramyces sp. JEL0728]